VIDTKAYMQEMAGEADKVGDNKNIKHVNIRGKEYYAG
jgi:hypothetical protein